VFDINRVGEKSLTYCCFVIYCVIQHLLTERPCYDVELNATMETLVLPCIHVSTWSSLSNRSCAHVVTQTNSPCRLLAPRIDFFTLAAKQHKAQVPRTRDKLSSKYFGVSVSACDSNVSPRAMSLSCLRNLKSSSIIHRNWCFFDAQSYREKTRFPKRLHTERYQGKNTTEIVRCLSCMALISFV